MFMGSNLDFLIVSLKPVIIQSVYVFDYYLSLADVEYKSNINEQSHLAQTQYPFVSLSQYPEINKQI